MLSPEGSELCLDKCRHYSQQEQESNAGTNPRKLLSDIPPYKRKNRERVKMRKIEQGFRAQHECMNE